MMDEQALIQAAREGDLEAFNQLVLLYQDFLFSIALRILGTQEDAADATQEALIRAFRKFDSFHNGSLRSWLARVLVNICYDELRCQARHPLLFLDQLGADDEELDPDDRLIDLAPGPEQGLETLELDGAIRRGLRTLSPGYRSVLILVDIEGLSYEEAARAARIPVGTVKSRLARARLQMRAILQPVGGPLAPVCRLGMPILMKV